jgi:hypothetical protein
MYDTGNGCMMIFWDLSVSLLRMVVVNLRFW